MNIGVLALQGGFQKHIDILNRMKVSSQKVKYKNDFKKVDALIIPGGESTTLSKLIINHRLLNSIINFLSHKPVFGTCAGLILLSTDIKDGNNILSFKCLDIKVERNAWGRQISSFKTSLNLKLNDKDKISYDAIFIRAPKIITCNEKTKILSTLNNSPVMVRNKGVLATTFHPELTDDMRIHEYFLKMVKEHASC